MKKITMCIVLAVLVISIAACSGGNNWSVDESPAMPATAPDQGPYLQRMSAPERTLRSGVSYGAFYEADDFAGGADQVGWEDIAGQGVRHVIQFAGIEMETEYFDDAVAGLRGVAPALDGYVESEMLTARGRRMLSIVIRVPAASFETAISQIETIATVRVLNQSAQDVTDSFYDMIGSLELRRVEEERLLALIDEADSINEILALEQRLSDTRFSIEIYTSQLNNMAGQIAYSTIEVTLFDIAQEERIIISPTLGERIGGAFGDSVDGTVKAFQGFVVFLAGVVIPLSVLALIGFGGYKAARAVYRKRVVAR
ncbi:MAG: DUF4349 domain-containing protein [Defluviitaleaceae bacterium]|nr:DUF4349 domain-containing protein [Defluviitaleaceae bacterium]